MDRYRILNYPFMIKPNYDGKDTVTVSFANGYRLSDEPYDFDSDEVKKEDDKAILVHAKSLIEKRNGAINKPDFDIARYEDSLLNDYRNYLTCYKYEFGNRKTAYDFTKALFDLGVNILKITEIITGYYHSLIEEFDDMNRDKCLDFYNIYLNAADKELEKGNVNSALEVYDLILLDWDLDIFGSRRRQSILDGYSGITNRTHLETLCKTINLLHKMWRGQTDYSIEELRDVSICKLQEIYLATIECAHSYDEKCLDKANELLDGVGSDLKQMNNHKRVGIMMVFSLLRHCSLQFIYFLAKDSHISNIMEYADAVCKTIGYLDENKFRSLVELSQKSDKGRKHIEALIKLVQCVHEIDEAERLMKVDGKNVVASYYTKYDTFCLMLPYKCTERTEECGKLSIMHISYMNDPNEGKTLLRYLSGSDLSKVDKTERRVVSVPYVFIKCFTSRIDYLPMWEMYGDDARGVCLVLDWNDVKNVDLYRVVYIRKTAKGYVIANNDNGDLNVKLLKGHLKRLRDIRKNLSNEYLRVFNELLEPIQYLFKDSSYSYEQELRIKQTFTGVSNEFHHTNGEPQKLFVVPEGVVPIKEVILGAKFENVADTIPFLTEQLEILAEKVGVVIPKVTVSNIDFR